MEYNGADTWWQLFFRSFVLTLLLYLLLRSVPLLVSSRKQCFSLILLPRMQTCVCASGQTSTKVLPVKNKRRKSFGTNKCPQLVFDRRRPLPCLSDKLDKLIGTRATDGDSFDVLLVVWTPLVSHSAYYLTESWQVIHCS